MAKPVRDSKPNVLFMLPGGWNALAAFCLALLLAALVAAQVLRRGADDPRPAPAAAPAPASGA